MIPDLFDQPWVLVPMGLFVSGLLLYGASRVPRMVPRGSVLEAWAIRWVPTLQASIAVLAILWSVDHLFAADPSTRRWLTILVVAAVAWSARFALSDWWSGVVLRGDDTLRTGRRVSWQNGKGRLVRLGLRAAELETEDGHRVRVPYSVLAAGEVTSAPTGPVAGSHTFAVALPSDHDPAEQQRSLRGAAALSTWSAADPPPTVRMVEQGASDRRFEVTVYPIGPAEGGRIERMVREACGDPNSH